MIRRDIWKRRIELAWQRVPIVWLTGVRRVGKTTLAKAFSEAEYINCDLPRNRERLSDPEFFFGDCRATQIILDEVHQLETPSELLKIAADEFPEKKILATGSSTLAATAKFRDSLTGRKRTVFLPPVLATELKAFGDASMDHRFLNGGLPGCLLATELDPEFYVEWLDSYFARDVQELFRIGKRTEFLKLTEILIRNSGGFAEVTSLAKQSGLTRPTVMSYLEVLELTHVVHRLRPFHAGGKREILAQPKVYAFDSGFVCHCRGWTSLRAEDRGQLFEGLVLDVLRTVNPLKPIQYWRDKSDREIDFVIPQTGSNVDAFECKWNAAKFSPAHLEVFRTHYPDGRNYLVVPSGKAIERRRFNGIEVTMIPLPMMSEAVFAS